MHMHVYIQYKLHIYMYTSGEAHRRHLVASYNIALGQIQITLSLENAAEASCLAVWLGQTTAHAIFQ